ncbi:MAG: hypothetical protein LBK61_07560 [Spirochaetaceae bacterium]|jgi:hypothetical protein|nr:hypothetical protein [Spirochaetaceae bacterium]
MKKKMGFVVLCVVLLFGGCASVSKKSGGTDNGEKTAFIERQLVSLEQIVKLHKEIKDIDRSLEKLGPVAVIENGVYFLFDLDESGEKYEFKMEYPYDGGDAKGIRAAYDLSFYGNRLAAVISEEAFETADGQAQIFHEFVHCFQFSEGSWDLKMTLAAAREAWEKRDYMWDLNHPFPYTDENFINKTGELDNGYDIEKYHSEIKAELSEKDFEYMMWQEWNEGYARYIENLVRERFGLPKIRNSLTPPLERVVFYEIGSRYIETLIRNDPGLKGDIKTLFQKMVN